MAEVKVVISPEGETVVSVEGVCGEGCEALTRGIEQALGRTAKNKRQPEYFQKAGQAQKKGQSA